MNLEQWTAIYIFFISLFSFITLIRLAKEKKSLVKLLFSFALISLSLIQVTLFFNLNYIQTVQDWLGVISITSVLAALFSLIRNSKPSFASFPVQLVFVPYLMIAFFHFVPDSAVIKNLLQSIYQAGAIIVGLLIFIMLQIRFKNRVYDLISVHIFTFSFAFYWFDILNPNIDVLLSKILLGLGIILFVRGFKKRNTSLI